MEFSRSIVIDVRESHSNLFAFFILLFSGNRQDLADHGRFPFVDYCCLPAVDEF